MARVSPVIDSLFHKLVLRLWKRRARRAQQAPIPKAVRHSDYARQLSAELGKQIHATDAKLNAYNGSLPKIDEPHGTDWTWRPELFQAVLHPASFCPAETETRIGAEIALFHDCDLSDITLRQVAGVGRDFAPFGLSLEVLEFSGSFLSLVLEVPKAAVAGLDRGFILRIEGVVETEHPVELFARINIKNGPNTAQVAHEITLENGHMQAEFDLGFVSMNAKRVEKAWVDLIFEKPAMNKVVFRDMSMSRRRRSAF